MGPKEISGLPAHILLVHLAIVAVPVASLVVLVCGVWPPARRKLSWWIVPLIGLLTLGTVQVTKTAGLWLQVRVANTPLIARHAQLGKQMFWWALALFVASLLVGALAWAERRHSPSAMSSSSSRGGSTALTGTIAHVVVGVVAVAIAVGSLQQIYRTGEAGSKALWTHGLSEKPLR
jgi:hypothetical protein